MVITKDTIKYVAELARIHLDDRDLEYFTGQLGRILEYVEKIKRIDIENIEPTSHALFLKNVFRDDKVTPSLLPEEVISNAPLKSNNFFIVPKIIE